ncbi:MAG: sugar phosphate isomerase/epimerase [Acidobacteria bacterium]|nr:sugar phosphate isomerase/epimerase [Acidobacteriota bacterium]
MTRRLFLSATAAAAGSAAATRNIRWGLGIVTWVVRANRNKQKLDWPEILSDIAAGGFDGVEPFTQSALPVTDENMARLESLLPDYKLRVASIYWADRFHFPEEHDRIRKDCHRFLGYLKRFGSGRLTIGPPGPSPDETKAISNMAKIMNEVGKIALEQYGIKTGVHNHVDGLIENPRQIDQLMEETDPRYFNLSPDTAQIWMGGGDPLRMLEKYKRRIVYIHYKDIRAYHRGLRGYLDNVIELGRGILDFPAMHRILKSVNYQGWITIDLDNARISPLESAKVQREYIDKVLAPIYA